MVVSERGNENWPARIGFEGLSIPGREITSTAKTNLHWQFSQLHGDGEAQQSLAAQQLSCERFVQQEHATQHSQLHWRSQENPMEVKAIATTINAT